MDESQVCNDIRPLEGKFQIDGHLIEAIPWGNGHINRTFSATYRGVNGDFRAIHQWINPRVFKDPVSLMANVVNVTNHVRCQQLFSGEKDIERTSLRVIKDIDGRDYWLDHEGGLWRTYQFVLRSRTIEVVESRSVAKEAARAFARFQKDLATFPAASLTETIPFFHNTRQRYANLLKAIEKDDCNRANTVRCEIDFATKRESMTNRIVDLLDQEQLPLRVTHNDTKVNNVLFDEIADEAKCVIDLDTVMPGSSLYDFGDMVRTATAKAAEDEVDLSKVGSNIEFFDGLVDGYLSELRDVLTKTEISNLVFSGRLITFEIGLRFLTDYLEGDVYFRTHRPNHNLDRARTQFKMVEMMETDEEAMEAIVANYTNG